MTLYNALYIKALSKVLPKLYLHYDFNSRWVFHKAPVFPSSACFGFSVFAQLKVVFDMDCAFDIWHRHV